MFAYDTEDHMSWTATTREKHDRSWLRYASDPTEAEWALVQPFMPRPNRLGRPRRTNLREIWRAIQYMAATGCQWAQLPKEFPPFTTVQYYFYQLRDTGTLDLITDARVAAVRVVDGRKAEPTAGVIDSQSVKTTE